MIYHHCISLDSPDEWRAALKGIRHGFAHTWEHCYAMHLTTGCKTFLYCFEAGDVRIVCPIVEREFDGYVDIAKPYGFSGFVGNGDCPEFSGYWREFARQKGYVSGYLSVNPIFWNSTYFDPGEMQEYGSTYILDLTLSYDQLWANLSTNRRRQLRNWDKTLLSIVLEKSVLTDFCLSNYTDFVQRKNALSFYNFSGDTLSFLAGLDEALLVGAPDLQKPEAISMFLSTPDMAEYFINVSLPGGQHHSVALLWYAVNYLRARQVPILNLGGSTLENDGVSDFKQRFGGTKLPLRCLKQIYRPDIYEALCHQVGADPGNVTGYFPAYRRP